MVWQMGEIIDNGQLKVDIEMRGGLMTNDELREEM